MFSHVQWAVEDCLRWALVLRYAALEDEHVTPEDSAENHFDDKDDISQVFMSHMGLFPSNFKCANMGQKLSMISSFITFKRSK